MGIVYLFNELLFLAVIMLPDPPPPLPEAVMLPWIPLFLGAIIFPDTPPPSLLLLQSQLVPGICEMNNVV